MNEADWVVLRLARKLIKKDSRASLDYDVQRTMIYLRNRYGEKHFYRCIDELNKEEHTRQEAA